MGNSLGSLESESPLQEDIRKPLKLESLPNMQERHTQRQEVEMIQESLGLDKPAQTRASPAPKEDTLASGQNSGRSSTQSLLTRKASQKRQIDKQGKTRSIDHMLPPDPHQLIDKIVMGSDGVLKTKIENPAVAALKGKKVGSKANSPRQKLEKSASYNERVERPSHIYDINSSFCSIDSRSKPGSQNPSKPSSAKSERKTTLMERLRADTQLFSSQYSVYLRNAMKERPSERGIRRATVLRSAAIAKFRMLKFNSTSTLYVDTTITNADLFETLHYASLYIHKKIIKSVAQDKTNTVEILSEKDHLLSKSIQFYSSIPAADEICRFMQCIFCSTDLCPECVIISLIYLQRMLDNTGVHMVPMNWARSLLGAIVLASKVWDDHAVWNVDYVQIFPDVEVDDFNQLERFYLASLEFNVAVKPSAFTQLYFRLRDGAELTSRPWALEPARKYQLQTKKPNREMQESKPHEASNPEIPRLPMKTPEPLVHLREQETLRKVWSDTLFQPQNQPALSYGA